MIYPSELTSLPESRAEETVYNLLSKLSDSYDIFFSKRFVKLNHFEKEEYEIDFIICMVISVKPCHLFRSKVCHFPWVDFKGSGSYVQALFFS